MRHQNVARALASIAIGLLSGSPVLAIDPIPAEGGWSGFVLPGVGYMDIKSNTLGGNSLIDVERDTISSVFSKPKSESDFHAIASGEVKYTLGGRGTQFYLGGTIEDIVTLDFAQGIGMRQDIGNAGTVELGVLFSGIPPEVWEDPYVEDEPRQATDRDSTGARFRWDRIFGSDFEFEVVYRDVEIDTERSGEFLDLSESDRDLLRRDAELTRLGLTWRRKLSDTTILSPQVRYIQNDADGDAESYDGYGLQVSWAYLGNPLTVVGTVGYTSKSFDEANPIYGRKRDSDTWFLSGTVFYQLPTESKRWSLAGIATYGDEDSDIDFHDNTVFSVITGVQYRFGGKSGS